MSYDSHVLQVAQTIEETFSALGWTIDMVVDFGSHGRGEARPDSDYDVFVYVHRPEWFYLFSEYARRLTDPEDQVADWHAGIRRQFPGYQELKGTLEAEANRVVAATAAVPFCVEKVFDTRLMLFNMVRETWEIFSLVHGRSIGRWPIHEELTAFLKQTRPFHERFFDVHVSHCQRAADQAAAVLVNSALELDRMRVTWLSNAVASLTRYISLLSVASGGWFLVHRDEVLGLVGRLLPERLTLMHLLYTLKCSPSARETFRQTGRISDGQGEHTLETLQEECRSFGEDIHCRIEKERTATQGQAPEDVWLSSNLDAYRQLPLYQQLLENA